MVGSSWRLRAVGMCFLAKIGIGWSGTTVDVLVVVVVYLGRTGRCKCEFM
jgi:hypothetical protein